MRMCSCPDASGPHLLTMSQKAIWGDVSCTLDKYNYVKQSSFISTETMRVRTSTDGAHKERTRGFLGATIESSQKAALSSLQSAIRRAAATPDHRSIASHCSSLRPRGLYPTIMMATPATTYTGNHHHHHNPAAIPDPSVSSSLDALPRMMATSTSSAMTGSSASSSSPQSIVVVSEPSHDNVEHDRSHRPKSKKRKNKRSGKWTVR
jgi:hypothetical protein